MEFISEAIAFAVQSHDGMRRKKGALPYILHPMEAAVIVGTMTDDQNLIAAAVLHDVVEDAGVTLEDIEEKFGKRVRELVASETEDKRADLPPSDTWRIRKEESLAVLRATKDIGILMVWLAEGRTPMSDFTFTFHFHALEKEMATPVFLPGESQGWGSLMGCRL